MSTIWMTPNSTSCCNVASADIERRLQFTHALGIEALGRRGAEQPDAGGHEMPDPRSTRTRSLN